MNTIYDNTFVLGQTSATNFIAGNGIKIDEPSAGTVRIGNDETVLWTNPNPAMIVSNTTLTGTLNESISSFEKIRFDVKASYDYGENIYAARTNFDFIMDASKKNEIGIYYPNPRGTTTYIDCCLLYVSGNLFSATSGNRLQLKYPENTINTVNTARGPYIYEIRGINRISGSNA